MLRREKLLYSLVTSFALLAIGCFGIWWMNPQHLPDNFQGSYNFVDILAFLVLTYVIWHPIMMEVLAWAITSNIKNIPDPQPQRGLKVAFITTFVPGSESIELLHKTLPAMVNAHYAHDTWVLDEGDDPRVKEICKQYGVNHFSRLGKDYYNTKGGKYATKTKGGNHNSWYDQFGNDYEIVAQIDTDFVPKNTFLVKTLGHFNDPKVAFVGTPQIYGNDGDSFIARGAAEQTYNFYGPILRGLSSMNTTLLIGANHVIRVKALQDVGHYSAHITEDLLTGMKLHSRGWKSVYVPEVLAIGEGPATWQAYFNQQMRWAYGCINVLFKHSPRLMWKMSMRQRIYYFFIQQHYFSGLAMMLGTIGLGLYFFFGIQFVSVEFSSFLKVYLPAILVCLLMSVWLQSYNVRPGKEKGLLMAGKLLSVASWPIFFMAFIGVIRDKHLPYKVTRKGHDEVENPSSINLKVFRFHLGIALLSLLGLTAGFISNRLSAVMVFWAVVGSVLMLFAPFMLVTAHAMVCTIATTAKFIARASRHFRLLELKASQDSNYLPTSVTLAEKYRYIHRRHKYLMFFSVASLITFSVSTLGFISENQASMWPLYFYFGLSLGYFGISLYVNSFTKDFNFKRHIPLVRSWHPVDLPTVDIFLPTAGEPLEILRNTWDGVLEVAGSYKGEIKVYCLDDGAEYEVEALAREYGFEYVIRPDRGQFKKAGNLRNGFNISSGEYIVILDADFRPRHDFLSELLPYFYTDQRLGIVQSPQYFDVDDQQNWVERGAGAVQELFYRYAQVSRQANGAPICVGSNAVYRRAALDDAGGIAQIEHSEDVHTGFNIGMTGWRIQYVPVIVAKGLCPANMNAFFKQQYRWCLGSISLLVSQKFWKTKLSFRARMSYLSGLLYYIHTAVSSLIVPLIPIYILTNQQQVNLSNYLLIVPAVIFSQIIFPFWHKSDYGIEAWAVRMVYSWAHLFAFFDSITRRAMQWRPTGSHMSRDFRYINFRAAQAVFNFLPACIWVVLAYARLIQTGQPGYLPLLISGLYYLLISLKVTLYSDRDLARAISFRENEQNELANINRMISAVLR